MKYAKKINLKPAWQQQDVFCIDFCITMWLIVKCFCDQVLLPTIFTQSHCWSVTIIPIHLQTEHHLMTLVIIRG
jgi:hypothetical protein